jgi:hypothetical protein
MLTILLYLGLKALLLLLLYYAYYYITFIFTWYIIYTSTLLNKFANKRKGIATNPVLPISKANLQIQAYLLTVRPNPI